MLAGIGTAAGKFWVGLAVATVAGGAVATDAIEIPRDRESAEALFDQILDEMETVEESVLGAVEDDAVDGSEPEAPADGFEPEAPADGFEPEAPEPSPISTPDFEVDEPDPENHGQVVSELAQNTDLEGCEKGQAIAELASSKAADRRKDPDRDHDPCAKGKEGDPEEEAEEPEEEAEEPEDEAEEPEDETEDPEEETEEGAGQGGGKGKGKGTGEGNGASGGDDEG